LSQNQSDGICRRFKLTETPDQTTGRAFSYPYAGKGLRRFRHPPPRSLFREPPTAHRLQPWMVAPARRNSPPELSDSLLNRPRWVNTSVHFGPLSDFELFGPEPVFCIA